MKLYVNCITSGAELRNDIKTLIPEMNLRRRMSRVVNPTPFIQSTFNTVGAQIALLRGLHCYNTTYAHRWTSFENALVDAALRLGAGLSQAVLVGAFDETTLSVEKILQRLRVAPQGRWGESAVFFVLTAEAFDTSVAAITQIRIPADDTAPGGGFTTQGDSEGTEGRGCRESAPEGAVPAGTADGMRTKTEARAAASPTFFPAYPDSDISSIHTRETETRCPHSRRSPKE